MAEGRQREAWQRTASLMALTVNCNPFRDPGARLAQPADFDPYSKRAQVKEEKLMVGIEALKIFVPNAT
jgi:hypothetical protein